MNRVIKRILTVSLASLSLLPLRAQDDWTSTTSSSWNTPANWSAGVPTSTSAVTITVLPATPMGAPGPEIQVDTGSLSNPIASLAFTTINGTMTLAPFNQEQIQISGNISNTSGFVQNISIPITDSTLGGTATYAGGVGLNFGHLDIGNNAITTTGTVNVQQVLDITINSDSAGGFGTVSGAGMNVSGATVALSGAYTGADGDYFRLTTTNFTGATLDTSSLPLNGTLTFDSANFASQGVAVVVSATDNVIDTGTVLAINTDTTGATGGFVNSGNIIFNGGELLTNNNAGTPFSTSRLISLVTTGGTIAATTGTTATYNGVISDANGNGADAQLVIGDGTNDGAVVFTATNSYAGGTAINDATLEVSSNGNLGSGNLSLQNGGALETLANFTTAKTVSLTSGGRLQAATGTTATYNALISGTGPLTTFGGTVVLSGTNNYSGGTIVTGNGVLSVAAADTNLGTGNITLGEAGQGEGELITTTTSATSKNITLDGAMATTDTIAAATGTTATYNGVIGDTGVTGLTLTIGDAANTGTVVVTGSNTYTIGTTIAHGTLQIGNGGATGQVSGNIVDNSALVEDRSDTPTYAGVISGTGTVTQIGSGTLTFTGANTYSGATTVSTGTLALGGTGSLGATAITVASGATFAAVGTTNSIGTTAGGSLTIDGGGTINLQNNAINTLSDSFTGTSLSLVGNGTLSIDVGASGASDVIALTGAASLGGNSITVNVDSLTGATAGTTYTFVSASGGLALNDFAMGALTGVLAGDTFSFTGGGNSVSLVISNGSSATNYFYTGATSSDFSNDMNFNTAASGGTPQTNPLSSSSNVTIGSTAPPPANLNPITLNVPVTINSLTFASSGAGATLSGTGTLTIESGIVVQAGLAGTETISVPIVLGSSQTWTVNGTSTLAVGGGISGGFSLTTAGTGTLVLSGAGSYSGTTTVTGGTLQVASIDTNLGGGNIILGGGELLTTTTSATGKTVTLNAGADTLAASTATTATYNGAIGGSGSLLVGDAAHAGTVVLDAVNTYGGSTTINEGTLTIGAAGSVAASSGVDLANTGTTFDVSASNQTINDLAGVTGSTVNLGAHNLTAGTANSTTFAGVIQGTGGSFTKAGSGTLTLNGVNTYTGVTMINAGTVALGATGSLANSSGVDLAASGTAFDISAGSKTINDLAGVTGSTVNLGGSTLTAGTANSTAFAGVIQGTGGSFTKAGSGTLTLSGINTFTGATTINAGTVTLGAGGSLANSSGVNLTASGTGFDISAAGAQTVKDLTGVGGSAVNLGANALTFGSANSTSFAGLIAGAGGSLIKVGTGTFTLSAANTFSGGVTIDNGTLSVGTLAAVGTAQPLGEGGTVTLAGASAGAAGVLRYTGGAATLAQAVTVNTGTFGTISNTGGALLTLAGNISKNGSVLNLSGGLFNVTGVISGASAGSDLNVVGGSTVTLSNANTYNGPTSISGGSTLITAVVGALPTAPPSVLTFGAAGDTGGETNTLNLDGTAQTVGGLVDGGGAATNQVINSGAATTLTISPAAGATYSFSGALTGNYGVTVAGAGTQILTGTNGYMGGTTLQSGTLVVGPNALAAGTVTLNGGVLASLASISAGHGINVTGNFVQNAGNTLELTLNSNPSGTPGIGDTNDVLKVTGMATLNGSLSINFVPSSTFTPTKGQTFEVVESGGIVSLGPNFSMPTVTPVELGLDVTTMESLDMDNLFVTITSTQLALTGVLGSYYTPNRAAVLDYIDGNINSGPLFGAIAQALGGSNPQATVADIADQESPEKFGNFLRSATFNNTSFLTQEFDTYVQSLRTAEGNFQAAGGGIDSSGLTILDPSMDAGLAQMRSHLLAWSPSPIGHGLLSDTADPVTGGMDMKAMKTPPVKDDGRVFSVFVTGDAILAQDFSHTDLAHANTTTGGVQVGGDFRITPHLRAGVIFGYGHTDGDLDDIGSKATIDSYAPGAYVSYADNGWYVNALGSYGFDNFTEDRHISIAGLSAVAHGAPNGDQIVANLDGGYDFHFRKWTFGPTAGVQYTHLTVDSFSEDGAETLDSDQSINKQETDSLRSRVGAHVSYAFNLGKVVMTPHLDASWQHEFLDQSRGITSQFTSVGTGSFTIATPNPSRDSALIDGGLSADLNGRVAVFLDYLVQAGQSNYFGQSVQAGVKIGF
jgi:fibronectin-binding autotransporter adhesin